LIQSSKKNLTTLQADVLSMAIVATEMITGEMQKTSQQVVHSH
jgi:hypothetical protein